MNLQNMLNRILRLGCAICLMGILVNLDGNVLPAKAQVPSDNYAKLTMPQEIDRLLSELEAEIMGGQLAQSIEADRQKYIDDMMAQWESWEDGLDPERITYDEYASFRKTMEPVEAKGFDDFKKTLHQDYIGTWYDPESGEALRLLPDKAFVYISYLDMYGDEAYEWEIIDRSDKGLCPELAIYYGGRGTPPLAYYIAGYREGYFYGSVQGYVFYKQD